MSTIAFTPNASGTGTFTIASPDSNTNRTLTLPDADGALLTADDLPSGGATLLGTLATTSGTSVTLSSLDLTGYKRLEVIFENVSATVNSSNIRLNSANIGQATGYAVDDYFYGVVSISLDTGIFAAQGAFYSSFYAFTEAGVNMGGAGASGLTTASTSITFTLSAGNFDAGSIKFYGVA